MVLVMLVTSTFLTLTPGTVTPRTFRLRCRAVRPSSTPPAIPIAPVTAGITTVVTVFLMELPADPAVLVTFSVALLAVFLAPLPADFARELVARLAERALLRADFALRLAGLALLPEDRLLPPEDLELPPDAARELLLAAEGLLPLPLLLPEDLRLDVRPLVAAVLPDPEDPFDDVPEDFPREGARLDPRGVVAAMFSTSLSESAHRVRSWWVWVGAIYGLPLTERALRQLDECSREVEDSSVFRYRAETRQSAENPRFPGHFP